MIDLTSDELIRYQRHFPVIGVDGQKKLKQARVLCVGAGGLGCPALQYLAASGVGKLGILDGDRVELSNLQRQILFTERDIGAEKAVVVAQRLQAMNQHIQVTPYSAFFSQANQTVIQDYDVVLDATDNFEARYLLNSVCRQGKKPLISASIYQYDAQLSVFNYLNGPCYQCLYPTPPAKDLSPNCNLSGVIGVLPGVAGTLQAMEAIKVILGTEGILSGKLLCFNLLTMRFREFTIQKQACAMHPQVEFSESASRCEATHVQEISAQALSELLTSKADMQLIDVREPYEREICHIGGELMPLSTLTHSMLQLDKEKPVVIYCKSGVRSRQALSLLVSSGFNQVRHLEGGILNWQSTLDPTLKRY